jgi:hypothetical protein
MKLLRGTLPPRMGGTLGLLEANDRADVVFISHTGLEAAGSYGAILAGGTGREDAGHQALERSVRRGAAVSREMLADVVPGPVGDWSTSLCEEADVWQPGMIAAAPVHVG